MSRRMVVVLPTVVLFAGCATPSPETPGRTGSPVPAVSSAILAEAAAVITAENSHDHLAVLAHDSMMGRDSERPEIWTAARYIAGEFAAMGLEPMDENGDFIEEYPIRIPETDVTQIRMVVQEHGSRVRGRLRRSAVPRRAEFHRSGCGSIGRVRLVSGQPRIHSPRFSRADLWPHDGL